MIHHQSQVLAFSGFNEDFRLFGGGRHRLFHQQVLAVFKRFHTERKMSGHRRSYNNGIDIFMMENFITVLSQNFDVGIKACDKPKTFVSQIGNARHLDVFATVEISYQIRPPVTTTYDSDIHNS